MGVDCSAKLAFGVKLSVSEIEEALEKLGVEYEHDEPEYELADRYKLDCTEVGSSYSNDGLHYVIGPEFDFNSDFGGPDANAFIQAKLDGCHSLKQMIHELGELGMNHDPDWYLETLWW